MDLRIIFHCTKLDPSAPQSFFYFLQNSKNRPYKGEGEILNPSGSTDTPSLTACGARQGVKLNTDITKGGYWLDIHNGCLPSSQFVSPQIQSSFQRGQATMDKSGSPKKSPTADGLRASQPYLVGDPIPVPEVTELDTNSAWGLFEELAKAKPKSRSNPDAFAETVPAELEPMREKPKPVSPLK
jgi:hypothetical protein